MYKLYKLDGSFITKGSPKELLPDKFTGYILGPDNHEFWYENGKPHRLGGPALSNTNQKEYWIEDKKVTKEEHDLLYSIMKLKGIL